MDYKSYKLMSRNFFLYNCLRYRLKAIISKIIFKYP